MDFFSEQDRARKATSWLIFYFVVTVVLIIAIIYFVTIAIVWQATRDSELPFHVLGWHPQILFTVIGTVLATILSGCFYKIWELGGDGHRVAGSLGGKKIPPNTKDLSERVLLNVVEEMAIASGTPVPPVYLLDNEQGINAFAAGTTPQNAVIGITRGAVETLTRDQLQGVIAHEFSHILNGDMRLNLRLIGLLHGILVIAMIGYLILRLLIELPVRGSSRSDDGKGTLAILAIAAFIGGSLVVVGYVGVLFANLIQAAVSRQREFLADASAVQFTRNPSGIADALKRIGGWKTQSVLRSIQARETCHMLFGSGVRSQWFATHPRLDVRIRRLEPNFDGKFPTTVPVSHSPSDLIDIHSLANQRASFAGSHQAALAGVDHFEVAPGEAVEHVGHPLTAHIEHAQQLVDGLDTSLVDVVREPMGAVTVVYAMLLAPPNDGVRQSQLAMLSDTNPPSIMEELAHILPRVDALEVEQRLPTACMALPALDQLSERQSLVLQQSVQRLIEADRQRTFFEFAIQRFVSKRLVYRSKRTPQPRTLSFRSVRESFQLVLSTLAHLATPEASVTTAFQAGCTAMRLPANTISLLPRPQCTLQSLDRALNVLEQSQFSVCREMLNAFCACIASDQHTSLREIELLRVVSDALGCPMPPVLDLKKS